MITLRCYIDTNDNTMTEERLSAMVDNWSFFQTPPFTTIRIGRVEAGFGKKEWILTAPIASVFKEKRPPEYWASIGEEIFDSFEKPTKVSLYLDRESFFFKESPDYDCFFGIRLTATKVRDSRPWDFSGDDPSLDPRFW